jgi:hypothetical protein
MARHGGACLSVCADLVAFCGLARLGTTFAIVGEQLPKDSNLGIGPVTMANRKHGDLSRNGSGLVAGSRLVERDWAIRDVNCRFTG